ncbi:MAG TPA: hypothetical protein DDW18_01195 [Firmicutes bacterium]|nr:hypothetical protein [Bacillota bacterium]HBN00293.1 hypothetical protein [Bacillota bacterium]
MRLCCRDYESIRTKIAYLLEDYNVNCIPINVFDLVEKMNIKLILESEKHPKKSTKGYVYYKRPSEESYLYFDPFTEKTVIYLDDVGCSKERQRFSLAHEICHLILGHTEQNERNEYEANFGATYLLAPNSLVLTRPNDQTLFNTGMVSQIFEVSKAEANIIVSRNISRTQASYGLKEVRYETIINGLLKDSLNKRIEKIR